MRRKVAAAVLARQTTDNDHLSHSAGSLGVSESVVQSKLNHTRSNTIVGSVLRRNPPETSIVDILIVQEEVRVIEDVDDVGM